MTGSPMPPLPPAPPRRSLRRMPRAAVCRRPTGQRLPTTGRSVPDSSTRPSCAISIRLPAGRPGFPGPGNGHRWAELRRLVDRPCPPTDRRVVLRVQLILRGSRLQKAWFGDEAREPGDLDWVADIMPGNNPRSPEAPGSPSGNRKCFPRDPPEGVEFVQGFDGYRRNLDLRAVAGSSGGHPLASPRAARRGRPG